MCIYSYKYTRRVARTACCAMEYKVEDSMGSYLYGREKPINETSFQHYSGIFSSTFQGENFKIFVDFPLKHFENKKE